LCFLSFLFCCCFLFCFVVVFVLFFCFCSVLLLLFVCFCCLFCCFLFFVFVVLFLCVCFWVCWGWGWCFLCVCVCVCVCVWSEFYVFICKQLLLSSSHTHAWMHHVTRMRHATHTCVCTTSNIWMRHVIGILKRFFATLSAIGCISYINLTTTKNSQKLPAIVRIQVNFCVHNKVYGVATISRLLKIIGLICRI